MKILIISSYGTHPVVNGPSSFISKYVSLLRQMGHEVYFLYVLYYTFSKKYREIQDECIACSKKYWGDHYFLYRASPRNKIIQKMKEAYRKKVCNYYVKCDDLYPSGLSRYVSGLHDTYRFDACIINYYWLSKLLTKIPIGKKAMVAHDSFTYNNIRNNIRILNNLKPDEEAKALQRCPYIFAMQDEERVFFQRLAPKSKVLTSYCNYDFVNQPLTGNHNLVMLSGSFRLNVNGLVWFVKEVFPLILRDYPDCRLVIGGSLCDAMPACCVRPNIDLLGRVGDAADLYKLGDVAINPTYQGTGMKIKTFESVAYNKVTMVHPHSTSGIFDKGHAPLFASGEPAEWASFLRKAWEDRKFMESLRERNEEYIRRMNRFVAGQFEQFLG